MQVYHIFQPGQIGLGMLFKPKSEKHIHIHNIYKCAATSNIDDVLDQHHAPCLGVHLEKDSFERKLF